MELKLSMQLTLRSIVPGFPLSSFWLIKEMDVWEREKQKSSDLSEEDYKFFFVARAFGDRSSEMKICLLKTR